MKKTLLIPMILLSSFFVKAQTQPQVKDTVLQWIGTRPNLRGDTAYYYYTFQFINPANGLITKKPLKACILKEPAASSFSFNQLLALMKAAAIAL